MGAPTETLKYQLPEARMSGVSLSKNDWSLHRKGPIDQARHAEKVRKAIKRNMADIISKEAIITSDGKRPVKIPIRSLDLPKFRFDHRKKQHVGQGSGASRVGDVIGQDPGQSTSPGRGKRAGELPGIDYYEAEVTLDELAAILFEDLGLPNLKQKSADNMEIETIRVNSVAKQGPLSMLDRRRTALQNIKRNAIETGKAEFRKINMDDLRFRTWDPAFKQDTNAVVIAMRDVSGSMGEFEKYITRSCYFWMVRFLRTKYNNVKINFITHHTEAKEVDEEAFFKLGESGGTKVSSAYQLSLDMIRERYDPQRWNIYPFHFSDGDNWGDADNNLCLELVREHLKVVNMFGYGEIKREDSYGGLSTLRSAYEKGGLTKDPGFLAEIIRDKKDVYPTFKKFFHLREVGREGRLPVA